MINKRYSYKKEHKDILNLFTSIKINQKLLYEKFKKGNKKRIWTKEEYEFLVSNWGKLSKKEIANCLNRSINAVSMAMGRIGLKNYFVYSEEITLNQLFNLIYKRNIDSYDICILKRYKFPIRELVINKELVIKTLKITDFINWFKDYKRIFDLSLTEEGFLNIDEPDWMKEKRIADKKAAVYGPHNKVWTIKEDNQLKKLISQKYSYRDISIKLKRTGGAVKRRIHDLKLTEKPPKAYNHNKWTSQEIDLVKNMWLKGYKTCVIQEYLENRSDLAINGLLERYKYFGEPPQKFTASK